MFFNTGAGVAPRESAGVRILENGAGLRRALLVGTILGAGALMVAPAAQAADVVRNFTTPQPGLTIGTIGTDSVTVTSTSTFDGRGEGFTEDGIHVETVEGAITIGGTNGLGGSVTGTSGIFAVSTNGGAISIKTASGAQVTSVYDRGILTNTTTGATTIATGDLVTGIIAGIESRSTTGAITIDLGKTVNGQTGVYAESTDVGNITIRSAAGAGITGIGGEGVYASSAGGNIVIGDTAGLGGAVSGATTGISAATTVGGTIAIKTASGGTVSGTAGNGLTTSAATGATTIDLGANVSGAGTGAYGVGATASGAGDITIKTATGVTVTGVTRGISATSAGGNIRIGDATTGLGGAVSGATTGLTGTGIFASTTGTGTIDIKTGAGATVTGSVNGSSAGAINATSVNGDIGLNLGDTVQNNGLTGWAVFASSTGSGSITLTGAGNTTGYRGIRAAATTGAVTIGGSGSSSSGGSAISAGVSSSTATSDILINRSGAITSTGGTGVSATNSGSGKITIQGIGAVTATSYGINSQARSGETLIDLTNSVTATVSNTSSEAIFASSTTGAITIKTASGVAISSDTTGITATSSTSGAIDIGGTAGLGGAVSGRDGGAIYATTAGAGTVAVKTASGGNLTGGLQYAIQTTAVDGATTISIGSGSTTTGLIKTTSTNGNVTISNAGTVRGSLLAVQTNGGTGTFTFNNTGTLALVGSQDTGFAISNQSSGVLSLGGATMGVMSVSSLTMASGSKLQVRADASGTNDKLTVTGAATIATGAVLRVLATPQTNAAWSSAKNFTVLSAGTLTGNFTATETDYAFLKVTSTKTGNDIIATLERGWTSFGTYSTTPNQKSVSNVFDRFQTDAANPLIAKVATLTVAQAPVAMAQLSGTGVAAARTQSFSASGMFNGAVNAEMGKFTGSAGGGASVLSYAPEKKVTKAFDKVAAKPAEPILDGRVWMQVLGGVANMKSDAANPSERSTNFGLAAGADTALTPNIRAGFALSGGQSTSKVASLATKADATWGQAALYGVATDGARYAKAALVYGYLSTETERTVTAFSTPETAKGKFGANLFSTRFEVGQKFLTGGPVNVTPFFAFEPSWLVQNGYSETGAATVALGYGKTTTRALPATLGMKFDADLALDGMRVTPSATVGWVHNFADTASLSPFFVALPGSTFTVAGAKGDRDLARTELNLEATPTGSTATFYANARADLGARTNAVRGTAGAMLRF